MRKAGGTSLRWHLEAWTEHTGRSVDVVEGWTLGYPDGFRFGPETIHLTSLRDPIDRLKSAYRFEGRWPQAATTRSPETAKSFAEWAHAIAESDPARPGWLWQCSSNYYVKSLTGHPRVSTYVDQHRTDEAKRVLEQFEVVLITEQFSSAAQQQYLKRRLDFDHDLALVRPWLGTPSPVESDGELFDEPTISWLRDSNLWDIELYEFAVDLCASRIGQVPLNDASADVDETDLGRRAEAD